MSHMILKEAKDDDTDRTAPRDTEDKIRGSVCGLELWLFDAVRSCVAQGMSERNFRCCVCRFEVEGEADLEDKRSQAYLTRGVPLAKCWRYRTATRNDTRIGTFAISMAGIGVKEASAATVE